MVRPVAEGPNFVAELVDRADPERRALVELTADGGRAEWTFGAVAERSARLSARLREAGVGRGDVVMTLAGNSADWVATVLGALRIGAVVLPCTEQLRAADLRLRLEKIPVAAVVADERNRRQLEEADPECAVLWFQDERTWRSEPDFTAAALVAEDSAVIVFSSGTTGEPKAIVHGQRYLWGQRLQARNWLAIRPGELMWCTAAAGWSKSVRNVFVAPWLGGGAALLHDARFDPEERLAIIERERVEVLCMSPTEYRVCARRTDLRPLPTLRAAVAAGEALDAETMRTWQEPTGLTIRDGYGQTETGHLTATPLDQPPRPGSMGLPLPGIKVSIEDGELVLDAATVPTFFLRYHGSAPPAGRWRTGDRVSADEDGYLYFEGRADDVIISAGYRIGPFEVESALLRHPAVAEAAAVPYPDPERGAIVRAVLVLGDGYTPSDALTSELQQHVKETTAPYKYPRRIEYVEELPKTPSGKVRRAELRDLH